MAHVSYNLVAPERLIPASPMVVSSLVVDMFRELIIDERFTLLSVGTGDLGGAPGHWFLDFPGGTRFYYTYRGDPVCAPGTTVSGWLRREAALERTPDDEPVEVCPDAIVRYDGTSVDGLLGALKGTSTTEDIVVIASPGRALGVGGTRDEVLSILAVVALAQPLVIGHPGPGGVSPWHPYVTIDARGNVLEPVGAEYDSLDAWEMVSEGILPDGYTWSHQVQTVVAFCADGGGLPREQHQPPFADVLRRHLGPGLLQTGEFY